jgi:hypothetical protein
LHHGKYKTKVSPPCPVAIQLQQFEVHAPEHILWGIVTCDLCGKQFAIGRHRIYGSHITDVQAAEALTIMLEDNHSRNEPHQNSYELQD